MIKTDKTKEELSVELDKSRAENDVHIIQHKKDISEQAHLEKATNLNQERSSILLNSLSEMVVLHELVFNEKDQAVDYRIIDCNEAFTKITGIDKVNAVGKLATEVYQTETSPYLEVYSKVAITGESHKFSTYYTPMNKHFLISVVSPGKNQFATISTDITDIKRIEENLIESEERFQMLFEQAPLGYQSLDEEGNFIIVNQTWLDILGYSNDEVVGKWFGDFLAPMYKDAFRQRFAMFKAAGKIHIEFEMVHKDGSIHFIAFEGRIAHHVDGSFKQTHCILADITEQRKNQHALKASEQRFRQIFNNTNDAIYIWRLEHGKTIVKGAEVNDVACKMLGYSKEEFMQMSPADFSGIDSNEKISDMITPLLSERYMITETLHRTKDGRIIPVEVSSRIVELMNETNILSIARDITDRKKTQQALEERERYQRALLDNFPFAVWLKDTESRFLAVNQTFADTFKVSTPEELVGKTDFDITEYNAAESYRAHDRLVMQSRQKQVNEEEVIGLGERNWSETYKAPVINENGELLGTVGFLRDISERKYAEEIIKKNEQLLRDIVDSSPFPVAVADVEDNNIKYWSSSALTLFGHTAPTASEWYQLAYPDSKYRQEVIERWKAALEFAKKSGNHVNTGEYRLRCHDGSELICELYAAFIASNLIITFNDITERKRAEEVLNRQAALLQAQANSTIEGIIVVDPQGKKIFQNRRTIELWKIPQNIADNPDDSQQVQHVMSLTKDPEQFVEKIIYLYSHPDETTQDEVKLTDGRVLDRYSAPVLDKEGLNYGRVWTFRDITEHKRAEEELKIHRNHLEELVQLRTQEWNNANEELQIQIERSKEIELMLKESLDKEKVLTEMQARFISTTSHEFRTPLTAVLSSTELLQRYGAKWTDIKKNEHYNRITESVEYLTKLLDDVLTISRTETGKINFNPESVDLFQLISECSKDTKSLMTENHEFRLNYNLEEKKFHLDRKLMRFIFSNLLSNAAKYSPTGGTISMTINQDQQQLIIEISDQGIGIPPEEVDKIFDSFYRTKNTGTIEGTGLGLAIVKRAVDLHSGDIKVTSKLNKGTTFTVTIPININV